MKTSSLKFYGMGIVLMLFASCMNNAKEDKRDIVHEYDNILDIAYTPNNETYCTGFFSDQGAWIGYTLPQKDLWTNGFCGPFNMLNRTWISPSLVNVGFAVHPDDTFTPDSTNYFPGELYMQSSSKVGTICQRLFFIDDSNLLLECSTDTDELLSFKGKIYQKKQGESVTHNKYSFTLESGENWVLTFPKGTEIKVENDEYNAIVKNKASRYFVQISSKDNLFHEHAYDSLINPSEEIKMHNERWNAYLHSVLRNDMPAAYNRIAVKAVVTLLSNWKASKGGILHEGVVPSHAVGYFMGFWAWDSWKHAVALAKFAPNLAKNQIRAMFDYQQKNGMIIDCIYPDIHENNARDSKPPLAAWAVHEVFNETHDTLFVKEMFPQLVKYYQWWFKDRDHNNNGICEFGSVDGTLEAAAWESGMDNAIRFDDAKMVKNHDNAWSFDQESVDLNAFLIKEYTHLTELAIVAGQTFAGVDNREKVRDYFYDEKKGFFFDRKLTGEFVEDEGSEAYIPIWAEIATKEQMANAMKLFADTTKFSTFIPFPTVAADHPKFMPKGYWRGPIWLDQTYFAISGLRKYGYIQEADKYTQQVFDRLEGLTTDGAIHENYGTHTGEMLKAPHFSWSAAHLLMLYLEHSGFTK